MINTPPGVGGDPTVRHGGLYHTVKLAPTVTGVKTGTPLVPSAEGYVTGNVGVLFAAVTAIGGEEVVAYRSLVMEVHNRAFVPGMVYTITQIDAYGGLTFDPPPPVRAAVTPPPTGESGGEVQAANRSTRGTSGPTVDTRSLAGGTALALDETHLLFEGA